MWGIITFVIAAWVTPTALPQFSDTTSVVMLEYSESMSIDSLLYPGNYSIVDADSNHYQIYKVGIIHQLEDIIIPDTSLVAIVAERLPYRKEFTVRVNNVKDRAGNLIGKNHAWFFFNGFAPNRIPTPGVGLK